MPTGFGPHRDLSLRIWTLGGQQFALRIHSSKTVNNLRRAVRRLTKKQGQFDLVHSKKGATFGTDNDFGSAECRAVRQKTLRQLHIRSGNDIQILAVPPQIDSDGEELPWLLSDSSDDEIPCRVADSSDDDVDGVPIERRQGEPVGALGSDWRETRRQNRSLFYAASTDFTITPDKWEAGPVRVWFQDKADRLEQEASEARAALATGSSFDEANHKKQMLLTSFFQGSPTKQPDKHNSLARFRGGRGAVHPACQTLEQRHQRLKKEEITKQRRRHQYHNKRFQSIDTGCRVGAEGAKKKKSVYSRRKWTK